ncbi:hypothetical protein EKH79_08405 [Dyella dinghuensis]|uniref:DUF1579 domain-containing protein n=1 Tax=Dyella dinghuensis TaxID=1920169 RepID=A0A432LSY5_9GAMM|nr:hypothetical protein [Dyella dinghuensis]RUL64071.1 hypothetical protein EKH79_08405 [Dyella dinghuensis]
MPKLPLIACVLMTSSLLVIVPKSTQATPAMTSNYCKAPEFRQFDFWLGDWDTFRIKDEKPASTSVARNRVTSILGGCALREVYTRTDGYSGESFTIYDASRNVWHQSWVSNQGELVVVEGAREGNNIVLSGRITDTQGVQLQRVTWEPVKDGVRETCLGSRDNGKTWTVLFDILFRPHAAS